MTPARASPPSSRSARRAGPVVDRRHAPPSPERTRGMTVPVFSLALALACALFAAAPAAAQPKETPLTASTISGPSEIILKNGSWVPAKLRDTIAEGDGARALAGGRLTLLTNNGNSIRLAQLT